MKNYEEVLNVLLFTVGLVLGIVIDEAIHRYAPKYQSCLVKKAL